MNVADGLERAARRDPDRVAVDFEGAAVTYAQLHRRAARSARRLAGAGIGRGDRVAILLPNVPDFVVAYYGALMLGAVAVSVSPQATADEVRFIVADSGAGAIVSCRETAPALAALPSSCARLVAGAEADPDTARSASAPAVGLMGHEPAALLYTSGTTGTPRGVLLSHANVLSNASAASALCGIVPGDRLLLFVPLSHCFGQNAILNCAVHAGATVVLHRRFVLERVLEEVARGGVTRFYGVPAVYARLLAADLDTGCLASVPYFFSAAAPLPDRVERRWRERFGAVIHQGYGLTETSPFVTYNHGSRVRPGTVGTPIDGVTVRIVGPDGAPLPPGETGEVVVHGPNVMLGYWRRPAETAAAIRDGWLHTGDVGRMDADGYLRIVERMGDVVNTAGFKVSPAEVERVLARHPAVGEVAVYGAPHPMDGDEVRAAVVLVAGRGATAQELDRFCRRRLAAYKVPRGFDVVAELPRNGAGKVLRRVLRERRPIATRGGAHASGAARGGG